MAQRIGISVSDELFKEVQRFKGDFKVSKVCQNALIEAVKLATLKKSQDIEALKERLNNEREELFKPYKEEGFNDGVKDAYSMSYKQIKGCKDYFFGEMADETAPFQYFASKEYNNKYDSIYSGELVYKCDAFSELSDDESDLWTMAADIYWQGWDEGVKYVLKQLDNL